MTIRPIDAKAPEGLDRQLEHMVYSHITQASKLDDEREQASEICNCGAIPEMYEGEGLPHIGNCPLAPKPMLWSGLDDERERYSRGHR